MICSPPNFLRSEIFGWSCLIFWFSYRLIGAIGVFLMLCVTVRSSCLLCTPSCGSRFCYSILTQKFLFLFWTNSVSFSFCPVCGVEEGHIFSHAVGYSLFFWRIFFLDLLTSSKVHLCFFVNVFACFLFCQQRTALILFVFFWLSSDLRYRFWLVVLLFTLLISVRFYYFCIPTGEATVSVIELQCSYFAIYDVLFFVFFY